MTTPSGKIFARGYAALENEDLDGVRAAMAEADSAGVERDDARVRYLDFMATWLDEDAKEEQLEAKLAELGGVLEAAVELDEIAEAGRIVLDLSDVLAQFGEFDDIEHALRSLCEREDLSDALDGEARLLRAQILLDRHEDPDEALAVLEEISDSLREDSGYVSLQAAVLVELDRTDEAIELLEDALERSDETELRYQLGIVLRAEEREDEAIEHLLEVRRRDLAEREVEPAEPVPDDEVEDLRRHVEDVLDSLPDQVISRVAAATIRVERWISEEAIREGADPRTPINFEGEPASSDDEGHVDALVVFRDMIVAYIEDDDEIVDFVALGLVEEFDRYFDLELIPGM